jgi:Zn-dependent protease
VTDLTLQVLVLRLAAVVFIAAVHGFAVAAAAVALGDPGPRHDGRLSINPLVHLDVVGTVSGVLFALGWIRPVAVDPACLRGGRPALALVVAAGSVATLAAAMALHAARPLVLPLLPDTAAATAFVLVDTVAELSVAFALVNLVPLPPLTGAHLLAMTRRTGALVDIVKRRETAAGVVLALVAASGVITRAAAPLLQTVARFLLGG